jgi:hypothetical protein
VANGLGAANCLAKEFALADSINHDYKLEFKPHDHPGFFFFFLIGTLKTWKEMLGLIRIEDPSAINRTGHSDQRARVEVRGKPPVHGLTY